MRAETSGQNRETKSGAGAKSTVMRIDWHRASIEASNQRNIIRVKEQREELS
jgi:hypothetical protein